jgi:hypothetical protein
MEVAGLGVVDEVEAFAMSKLQWSLPAGRRRKSVRLSVWLEQKRASSRQGTKRPFKDYP